MILNIENTKVLKCIAIMLVIFQHIGQAFKISFVNPLGPVGVYIFLFLSGYGLTSSYIKNGNNHYFCKKIVKIYLPYALTVILFVIWSKCIRVILTTDEIIKYFLLISLPQGSYWFIPLIIYWYIIFYFLTKLYNTKYFYLLLLFASLFIIVINNCGQSYLWQIFSFPLGILTRKHKQTALFLWNKHKSIDYKSIIAILFVIIFAVIKKSKYVESRELGFIDTFSQLVITIFLSFLIIRNVGFINKYRYIYKVMISIGNISYELYLSHAIMLDYLNKNPYKSFTTYLCISTCFLIVISIISKKIKKLLLT